jgi:hypothetical protein
MFEQHALSMKIVTPPFEQNDPLTRYGGFVIPPDVHWWEERGVWVRIRTSARWLNGAAGN